MLEIRTLILFNLLMTGEVRVLSLDWKRIVHETGSKSLVIIGENLEDQLAIDGSFPVPVATSQTITDIDDSLKDGGNLIVIFGPDNPTVVSDILLSAKASLFITNIWIVVHGSGSALPKTTMEHYVSKSTNHWNWFGVNSQLYLFHVDPLKDRINVTAVVGQAYMEPKLSACGVLFDTCNLMDQIQVIKNRMDHGGQKLRLTYESWIPLVAIHPNGSIDGLLPAVVNVIADKLNLSLEFVRVRDPSAGRLPNGTWTGDLADVGSRFVDAGIWGYVPTLERLEIVDFTLLFGELVFGPIIRRPRSDDISLVNYIGEYKSISWLSIGIANLFCWIVFITMLVCQPKASGSLVNGITIMLRTMINKVTH